MKENWRLIVILPAVLLSFKPGWCHGVDGRITTAQGYLVMVQYDDGEPMSYAKVEILSPDKGDPFQTGHADRNGVMMFHPDCIGRWHVVVRDGMGHLFEQDLEIGDTIQVAPVVAAPDAPASSASPANVRAPGWRLQGIISGLSVIAGLFGLLYGLKARRRYSKIA